MKHFACLLCLILSLSRMQGQDTTTVAQPPTDTTTKSPAAQKPVISPVTVTNTITAPGKTVIDSPATTKSVIECKCIPQLVELKTDCWKWTLVFSPFILFFVVLIPIMVWLLKSFDIKEAMTENETEKKTILNEKYTVENLEKLAAVPNLPIVVPPTIVISEKEGTAPASLRPSISRYIAFITSVVTILLVVCLTSFFIYHYIRTGCAPDFSTLSVVLIALGLGITPYITNKITTAASADKSS